VVAAVGGDLAAGELPYLSVGRGGITVLLLNMASTWAEFSGIEPA